MRGLCAALVAAVSFTAFTALGAAAQEISQGPQALRVCADPDNLPYSHENGSGFENRIAQLVADDLQLPLRYAWLPDRRGFVRKTMGEGLCDVIIGVPAGFDRVATTVPYYRSSYVFVERETAKVVPASYDDPALKQLRIGVQLVGDDLAATPPGHALAHIGATANVTGFPIAGDEPSAARMVRAIADGKLDAAAVWGPQAAYFASRAPVALRWRVLRPPSESQGQRFEFSIAMGVRRGDAALRERLNDVIARRQADIDRILDAYSVPRVATRQK